MRMTGIGLALAAALSCAGPAYAQYGRSSDPCSAPAMQGGNAVVALIGMLGQHSRDEACAAERRAQWDAYNARQKVAKDAADAAAARSQEQRADAGRQEAAAHEEAAPKVRPQHLHAAAEPRVRHARADRRPVERETAAVQVPRRQTAIMLVRAENAPDNHCREPELARRVINAWNGLDAMRNAGIKAVDIEHLSTVSFDAQARAVACHGVFVTSQGLKIIGTATVKTNVAGDPMFVWERDERQDFSQFAGPAPVADAPELAHAVHVEQAATTVAAPLLSTPASLSLTPAPQR